MTEQYIVAVFLGADLNVDACGPFRSLERAEGVRDRINEAGDWTDHPDVDGATIIAQVVPLRSVADLVAAAGPPSDWGEVGVGAGEDAARQLISVPTLDPGSAWVTRSEDCPEAPAQAHLPAHRKGSNAEDCDACAGRNLPYPWICDGGEADGD